MFLIWLSLVANFFVFGRCFSFSITVLPKIQISLPNSRVSFRCSATLSTNHDINYYWMKNGDFLDTNAERRFKIRDWGLIIDGVSDEDFASYQCIGNYTLGAVISEPVRLEKAEFIYSGFTRNPTFGFPSKEGSALFYEAPKVTSRPSAKFAWSLIDAFGNVSDVTVNHYVTAKGHLLIVLLDKDYNGYSPRLNVSRKLKTTFSKLFQYKDIRITDFLRGRKCPDSRLMSPKVESKLSVFEGEEIYLDCLLVYSRCTSRPYLFQWVTPKMKRWTSVRTFRVGNAKKSDEGTYTCILKGNSLTFRVEVIEKPKFVREPQNDFNLTKNEIIPSGLVKSYDAITWYFNAAKIRNDSKVYDILPNGSLLLKTYNSRMAGIYQIFCENKAGIISRMIRVRIFDVHPSTPVPVVNTTKDMQTNLTLTTSKTKEHDSGHTLYFILGCSFSAVLILAAVVVGSLCCRRNRKAALGKRTKPTVGKKLSNKSPALKFPMMKVNGKFTRFAEVHFTCDGKDACKEHFSDVIFTNENRCDLGHTCPCGDPSSICVSASRCKPANGGLMSGTNNKKSRPPVSGKIVGIANCISLDEAGYAELQPQVGREDPEYADLRPELNRANSHEPQYAELEPEFSVRKNRPSENALARDVYGKRSTSSEDNTFSEYLEPVIARGKHGTMSLIQKPSVNEYSVAFFANATEVLSPEMKGDRSLDGRSKSFTGRGRDIETNQVNLLQKDSSEYLVPIVPRTAGKSKKHFTNSRTANNETPAQRVVVTDERRQPSLDETLYVEPNIVMEEHRRALSQKHQPAIQTPSTAAHDHLSSDNRAQQPLSRRRPLSLKAHTPIQHALKLSISSRHPTKSCKNSKLPATVISPQSPGIDPLLFVAEESEENFNLKADKTVEQTDAIYATVIHVENSKSSGN